MQTLKMFDLIIFMRYKWNALSRKKVGLFVNVLTQPLLAKFLAAVDTQQVIRNRSGPPRERERERERTLSSASQDIYPYETIREIKGSII